MNFAVIGHQRNYFIVALIIRICTVINAFQVVSQYFHVASKMNSQTAYETIMSSCGCRPQKNKWYNPHDFKYEELIQINVKSENVFNLNFIMYKNYFKNYSSYETGIGNCNDPAKMLKMAHLVKIKTPIFKYIAISTFVTTDARNESFARIFICSSSTEIIQCDR